MTIAVEDALRLLAATEARLALVQTERLQDGTFRAGLRLAHARAMVLAAERRLERARETIAPC